MGTQLPKRQQETVIPLNWCHNECDGVPNRRHLDWLLNCLFRHRSEKISKFRVTGLVRRNHRWPVDSPHKGPVTRKRFLFDDVIMVIMVKTNEQPLTETEMSSVSLIRSSQETLKASINVPSDDHGSHPDSLSASVLLTDGPQSNDVLYMPHYKPNWDKVSFIQKCVVQGTKISLSKRAFYWWCYMMIFIYDLAQDCRNCLCWRIGVTTVLR